MLKNIILILFAVKLAVVTSDGWDQYKLVHKKSYSSPEDEHKHRQHWEKAVKEIFEHNTRFEAGTETYRQAVNQFADWSKEELDRILAAKKPDNLDDIIEQSQEYEIQDKELPSEVNWIERGAVTPVKSGGACGNCWAFATIASLECQTKLLFGHVLSLSEQQLTDCCPPKYGGHGCSGGWSIPNFEYTHIYGVEMTSTYPYKGVVGKCQYSPEKVAFKNNKTFTVYPGTEPLLKQWVAEKGVVSVGIEITDGFVRYHSGVFTTNKCSKNFVNHAVAVVGYGTEDGKDYWLVKNSWSTWWGDRGYIKMARNHDNMCSIATYPVVANYYLP